MYRSAVLAPVPAALDLTVAGLLDLEPRQAALADVGRRLILGHQPLITALEHLLPAFSPSPSGGVAISAGARRRSHSNREISFWSKIATSPSRIKVGG